MKQFIIFCALLGTLVAPVTASPLKASVGLVAPVSPADLDPELMELMCDGIITSLHIYQVDYDCTLSAEVSYLGISVTMSITAKTCEEAGAGLAKAVKAFYKEVSK